MRTGIPYREWVDGDPAVLATALELLEEEAEHERRNR